LARRSTWSATAMASSSRSMSPPDNGMRAKRSSRRWRVGWFTAGAADVVGHGDSRPTRGTVIRGSGGGVGGGGSRRPSPPDPTSHGTSTLTRPPIGGGMSSSRSSAGTRSIVPWAPVMRNWQLTMLPCGLWRSWTRPSIGYTPTALPVRRITIHGVLLTNAKQSLARGQLPGARA
jgi:hypothetical protein